jgi:methanogenic corrinoid protein MtbC1
LSEIEQRLQQLTNSVLAGKTDEAKQNTYAALARGGGSNEVLDAISEAVNIIVDLCDLGQYDSDRVMSAENAVSSSLQVIEEKLLVSQEKFHVKATVGPLGLKAGGLLSMAVCGALRSIGFKATPLNKTQTALDLLRNSEEMGADLVMALLAREDAEGQLQQFAEQMDVGGFRAKFEVIAVAPGVSSSTTQFPLSIAENSGEGISKATEWALKRTGAQKGERPSQQ